VNFFFTSRLLPCLEFDLPVDVQLQELLHHVRIDDVTGESLNNHNAHCTLPAIKVVTNRKVDLITTEAHGFS
jgi:hypothetical protein